MAPRWLDEREQRAWRAFLDVHRVLALGIERQLAESGLSGADYQVLVPLSETPDHRLRPRDLVRETSWDRSRLAHQLRRMEGRGLVRREECIGDRRGTLVALTPTGIDAVRRAAPGHVAWVREHFIDLLTEQELDVLAAVFSRVIANVGEAGPRHECEADQQ